MGRGRLFTILLLLTIVGLTTRSIYPEAGAVTTQTTTSRTLTTSTSSLASVTSISSKTSAITSIVSAITSMAPTSSSTLNDLLVLKTKYPKLFNPNNTYTEFASIDLSTNPKANGPPVTFRNVTVTHSYVSGMLVPNGVQWTLTQGPPDVVVFALADYGSQVPTSASLSNSVNTFLVTPRSGAYPHVYLFLVS